MNKYFLYDFFYNTENIKKLRKKIIPIKIKRNLSLKKVDTIYANLNTFYSSSILKKYQNLKYIISATTGTNHIDLTFCKNNKIKIINLESKDFKKLDITSTAEHTLALIIMACKKLSYFMNDINLGVWNREAYKFFQFKNYTIGIIGYGRIGKILEKYLKKIDFKLLIYDSDYKKIKSNKNKSSLNNLLKYSDIISLNLNYSNQNKNFFDKKKLKLCKKNVSIINTARGELINENHLIKFLKKNVKASAYLDVIKNEQNNNLTKFKKNFLYKFYKINKNLLLTPHLAGSSLDAKISTENYIIEKYLREIDDIKKH